MNKELQGQSSSWSPIFDTEDYNNYGDDEPDSFKHSFDGRSKIAEYKTTACMNDEINAMAFSFLKHSEAGKDEIADCLALTYYAGNYNGAPMEDRPIEVQDIYARLDRNIAALLDELDKRIGLEHVVVSIASTGYVMESGETGEQYRLPSGTLYSDRIKALLNVYLSAIYAKGDYIEGVYGNQLYLDTKFIERQGIDKYEVISHSIEFLKSLSGVEDVFTIYSLGGMLSPELQYVKNGYNPVGSGDIWLRLLPGWRITEKEFLTVREVYRTPIMFPIILFGQGIAPAVIEEMTPANILAAEMARILRIRRPNDNALRVYR
jgi:hypothetical protein